MAHANGNNGTDAGGPVGAEKINTDIVTLTRFLTEEQTKHKEATGDFTYVSSVYIRLVLLTVFIQLTVSRPPILLQVNCILYSTCHPDQSYRPSRLLQYHRRRPKEARRDWE